MTNFGYEYLYLGAPAIFGIAMFVRYRQWRPMLPALASAALCLIFLVNPFQAVSSAAARIPLLAQVVGAWYFLAGLTATAAAIAAFGIDEFLTAPKKPLSTTLSIAAIASASAWIVYELHAWTASSFHPGWWSALDAVATLTVFALCILATRDRMKLAIVLLLVVAVDYKSFGTSKRFNARAGQLPHEYARDGFSAMDPHAFQALAAHPEDRILLDFTAPMPVELRHHGLATPQGFDPFVAERYFNFVKSLGARIETNREFYFDSEQALNALGVRYVITTPNGPLFARLETNPAFKLLGRDGYYFRVYEYQNFLDSAPVLFRTPEIRRYQVTSDFVFKEQFFPGWTATLDGHPIPIQLWHGAFQTVSVPPGTHQLEFRYHPQSQKIGAWITALSTMLLLGLAIFYRSGKR
jgi:hypothetical protein